MATLRLGLVVTVEDKPTELSCIYMATLCQIIFKLLNFTCIVYTLNLDGIYNYGILYM